MRNVELTKSAGGMNRGKGTACGRESEDHRSQIVLVGDNAVLQVNSFPLYETH